MIHTQYKLIGHRQNKVSITECPGEQLYEEIKSWSHWTETPTNDKGIQTDWDVSQSRHDDDYNDDNLLLRSLPRGKAPVLRADVSMCSAFTVIVILKQWV
jgi:hypothetical protein